MVKWTTRIGENEDNKKDKDELPHAFCDLSFYVTFGFSLLTDPGIQKYRGIVISSYIGWGWVGTEVGTEVLSPPFSGIQREIHSQGKTRHRCLLV